TSFSRDWSSDVCSSDLIVHRLLASESTRTIAEKTGLTVSTVNTYVKRIRKKVGARGRVELLARVVGSENIREMVRAADLTEREQIGRAAGRERGEPTGG